MARSSAYVSRDFSAGGVQQLLLMLHGSAAGSGRTLREEIQRSMDLFRSQSPCGSKVQNALRYYESRNYEVSQVMQDFRRIFPELADDSNRQTGCCT